MVQGETLTLDCLSLISCTFNIAFIICRPALLQHDTALPKHSAQARWRITWSIYEQSSLQAMSEVELYEGTACDTAVEECIFQCICTHKLQLELTVLHGIDSHIAHHQMDSVELSLTAYGDHRCMWWFLVFCSGQSLEDNEGFILPMNFIASGWQKKKIWVCFRYCCKSKLCFCHI